MKYLHIDQNVNILQDDAAKEALEIENDQKYVKENMGIISVPVNRWKIAQLAELKHWSLLNILSNDDRNFDHMHEFNEYAAISGRTFENGIELGCGPFTNMKIIANICKIKKCTLLDPLAKEYLKLPNCSYSKDYLYTQKKPSSTFSTSMRTLMIKLRPSIYKNFINLTRIINTNKIPVTEIIASPIETMPLCTQYDLIIIINVIEHCYDIDLVFKNILSIAKKGTIFIFHDKYYEGEKVAEDVKTTYDSAHPLQVDRKIIDKFLYDNFEQIFRKTGTSTYNVDSEVFNYEYIYYIGKKI